MVAETEGSIPLIRWNTIFEPLSSTPDSRNQRCISLLPLFEKLKEAYEITLVSVRLSVYAPPLMFEAYEITLCVCVSP
jgi:hypothetical protein